MLKIFNAIKEFFQKIIISISKFINDKQNEFSEFISKIFIDTDLQNCLIKYGVIYIFIFVVIILLGYAANDPAALTSKLYIYLFVVIIPFILLYFLLMNKTKNNNSNYNFLVYGLSLLFLLSLVYYFTNTNSASFLVASYVINILLLLIVIVGLAIFFYIYSNYLKSLSGWSGFFTYLSFYIPCLLIIFIKYILNEFKMTTNIVFVLFIIEIVLILLYFYLPKILNKLSNKDGIIILEESAFLDKQQILSSSSDLKIPDLNPNGSQKNTFRRNYSISLWVYLNEQSSDYKAYSKETNIFDYGNGKPRITYYNDSYDSKYTDKYIFYFNESHGDKSGFEISLPHQKWHNFVFNYRDSMVDLFINGNLEKSYSFTENNNQTFFVSDQITIGNTDGLYGAICNIKYYTEPLTQFQIVNMYNLLMNKNPPVNNL
jgi:hypothetical protein